MYLLLSSWLAVAASLNATREMTPKKFAESQNYSTNSATKAATHNSFRMETMSGVPKKTSCVVSVATKRSRASTVNSNFQVPCGMEAGASAWARSKTAPGTILFMPKNTKETLMGRKS